MTNYDTTKPYIIYNEAVLNKRIVTGELIFKACKRMKYWFSSRDDLYFDYDDVEQKINFMQKLKHTKSPHTGQQFILEPYQQWIVANIVGFKWKENDERVISTALLMLARKAGKTFFSAALLLALTITDKQVGAEGYTIANSSQQASIAFNHISEQCTSIDPKGKIFQRYRSEVRIPLLKSFVRVLSSETARLDGLSPQTFIVDEFGAARDMEIYNILRTGAGVRKNSLGIIISSAGFLIGDEYPLYSMYKNAKDVLDGSKEEDTLFAALYMLDEGDDWKNEANWIKANPTLGHTVSYKYLREQAKMAQNNSSNEVSVKTKNFNMFCQSSEVWFANDFVKSKMQPVNLHDYEGEDCFMGLDLSMENDFSAFAVLIPPNQYRNLNPDKFIFKVFIYIPDKALKESPNRIMYNRWIKTKKAFRTEGNVIDTLAILRDQLAIAEYLNIVDIAFDQYYAADWNINAQEQGLQTTKHLQSLGAFTPSTNMFEVMMERDDVILDDNPILAWMFSNVEMMYNDRNKTKKPGKSDKNSKIDGIIAMMEAITSYNADRGHQYGAVWSITEQN